MSYVQFVLNNRKKSQTATPSAVTLANIHLLPGLNVRGLPKNPAIHAQKKEYNYLLQKQIELEKKINGQSGQIRKATRAEINRVKAERNSLLGKIGFYDDSERLFGFKEVGDGF